MEDNQLIVPLGNAIDVSKIEYDLDAISEALKSLNALAGEPVSDLTITTANQGAVPDKLQELVGAYNSMHHALQDCIRATANVVQEVYDSRVALDGFEVIS